MIIASIAELKYHQDKLKHTVQYYENCKGLENSGVVQLSGTFKAVIADTVDMAVKMLRKQIKQHFACIKWFDPKPSDFTFRIASSDVNTDGEFWVLPSIIWHEYPVDDNGC